jgi:hypothetical protein
VRRGRPTDLTVAQIAEIRRLRRDGMQYKVIARQIGCTWYAARFQCNRNNPKKTDSPQWRKRRAKIAAEQTSMAAAQRLQEIAAAKVEASSAPPLKVDENGNFTRTTSHNCP